MIIKYNESVNGGVNNLHIAAYYAPGWAGYAPLEIAVSLISRERAEKNLKRKLRRMGIMCE